MSRAPTAMSTDSFSAMASAIRRASGTPRRWMPMSSRPSVPACFSTISCERRIVARRISSAVMIRRPVIRTFLASLSHAGGLTGPRPKGQTRGYRARRGRRVGVWAVRPPRSVDVDGHVRDATPRGTAADPEEVRLVEIDDARGVLRTVVGHGPLDAPARAADHDDRAAGQPHSRRTGAVEGRLAAERVARRLSGGARRRLRLVEMDSVRGPGVRFLARLIDRG